MLRTVDLSIGYSEPVVEEISVKFREGTLTQVVGANGSGKTTLLRTLVGLIRPLRGRVFLRELDVTGMPGLIGRYVGYVPQIFTPSYFAYPVSVEEFIESSYLLYRGRWPRISSNKVIKDRIDEVLRLVELDEGIRRKSFWELSGGQKQRVLIARALVHEPKLLILDEPLSSVDPASRTSLALTLIKLLRDNSVTVIMSSHDPTLLLPHTDEILLLGNGKWFFGKPYEILTEEVLKEVYGEAITVHERHIHIHDYHM
ncbi:MAG: metal ABC transporter ATP-binding protein [Zestosphaera sp.]